MTKITFIIAAAVCLAAFGCGRPETNVANATPPATVANASPKPAGNENRAAANPPAPADESEEGETGGFEGTAGTTEKKRQPADGAALLTDVRTGGHGEFDRLVFEFAGGELPGYHIEYIDKPVRACGSGAVVPLKGDGWLEIRFSPANAHTEAGEPTVKERAMSPNLPIVKELKSTCDFEADVTWVAGLAAPNRYRVLELASPTRLVVDIRH